MKFKKNKYVAYNSQGRHIGHVDFCADYQMEVRRENVISITLRQVKQLDINLLFCLYFPPPSHLIYGK